MNRLSRRTLPSHGSNPIALPSIFWNRKFCPSESVEPAGYGSRNTPDTMTVQPGQSDAVAIGDVHGRADYVEQTRRDRRPSACVAIFLDKSGHAPIILFSKWR
jgi:hypothetical protein